MKKIKLAIIIAMTIIYNKSYSQYSLEYEITLKSNGKIYNLTKDYPGLYAFEITFKNGDIKNYTQSDLIKFGFGNTINPCENIENIKIYPSKVIKNQITTQPLPCDCEYSLSQLKNGIVPFEFQSISIKEIPTSYRDFSGDVSEYIIGEDPSVEFQDFVKEFLKEIGLSDLRLNLFSSNVESLAESLTVFSEKENTYYVVSLFYNEAYFKKLVQSNNQNRIKIILLHEIGHFIGSSYSGIEAEQKADYFAGAWLRKHYFAKIGRNDIESLFMDFPEQNSHSNHYTNQDRITNILAGWEDTDSANQVDLTSINEPKKAFSYLDSIYNENLKSNTYTTDNIDMKFSLGNQLIENVGSNEERFKYYFNLITMLGILKNTNSTDSVWVNLQLVNLYNSFHNEIPPLKPEEYDQLLASEKLDKFTKSKINYLLGKDIIVKNDSSNYPTAKNYLETSIDLDISYSPPYFELGSLLFKLNKSENWKTSLNYLANFDDLESKLPKRTITKPVYLKKLQEISVYGINKLYENNEFTAVIEQLEFFIKNNLTLNSNLILTRTIAYFESNDFANALNSLEDYYPGGFLDSKIKNDIVASIKTNNLGYSSDEINSIVKKLKSKGFNL